MRDLSLDIGFNLGAKPAPNNGGFPPLSQGFTVIARPGNPVSLARELKVADTLKVTLYRLYFNPALLGSVQTLSFKIEFTPAETDPEFESPVNGTVFDQFEIYKAEGNPTSTVFQAGVLSSWHITSPGRGKRYAEDQIVSGVAPPAPAFVLRHKGAYYFSLRLRVGWLDAQGVERETTFGTDPEMILGNDEDEGSSD